MTRLGLRALLIHGPILAHCALCLALLLLLLLGAPLAAGLTGRRTLPLPLRERDCR